MQKQARIGILSDHGDDLSGVAQVEMVKAEPALRPQPSQVYLAPMSSYVVEHDDLVASAQETACGVTSDETCPARDQDLHGSPTICGLTFLLSSLAGAAD